jgi:phosphoglycerate dehydrogenase-like enzyme
VREARVWQGPKHEPLLVEAVARAGGILVDEPTDANVFVWRGWPPARIDGLLHPGIEWVQLDLTGVDRWVEEGWIDRARVWTLVEEVYAPDVADHVVAFVLAAARRLAQAARQTTWTSLQGERLPGRTVGFFGAGAITREAIPRLRPLGVRILALSRSGRDVEGAERSLAAGDLEELLRESDYLVLAAPLTPETRGIIGERELDLIGPSGWVVNVARGGLVQTEALVRALQEGRIAGAGLDVTDPEPLPDGHPLWALDNVLVTPHVANPIGTWAEPLAGLVEENVRRFREGRELRGVVDVDRGY